MSARPRKRPAAGLKGELDQIKRERIMATAAELFAQDGYHNVSMEAVAEALGVTKPYVYYCFRDKNELLYSICSRGAQLSRSAIERSRDPAKTPLAGIEAYCRELASIVIEHQVLLAVYSREDLNLTAEQRASIAALRAQIDRDLADRIEAAVAAGEARAIEPLTTATAVNMMISTLAYWYRDKGPTRRETLTETICALALRMIRGAD